MCSFNESEKGHADKHDSNKHDKNIYFCNKSQRPHGKHPYIIFVDCPLEIRRSCDKVLVGPFLLKSNIHCDPKVLIKPNCICNEDFYATFTDPCGNPICPAIGQRFFISFCVKHKFFCFDLIAFPRVYGKGTMVDAEDVDNYSEETSFIENEEYDSEEKFSENSNELASYTPFAKICVCVNLEDDKKKPQPPRKRTVYQPLDRCDFKEDRCDNKEDRCDTKEDRCDKKEDRCDKKEDRCERKENRCCNPCGFWFCC